MADQCLPPQGQNQARDDAVIPHVRQELWEFVAPNSYGFQSPIDVPNVDANTFELKPALISLTLNIQFGGGVNENPNAHLQKNFEISDTYKVNGVPKDAIRLILFPFSLRDRAKEWLWSQPPGSFTNWEELSRAFLDQYFPPGKTAKYRNMINNFYQQDDETLYEALDGFKGLLQACPHHRLERWQLMHSFYNGVDFAARTSLDQAAGGAFMRLSAEEGFATIERLSANYRQWASERSNPKRNEDRYDLHAVESNESIANAALIKKFDSLSWKNLILQSQLF